MYRGFVLAAADLGLTPGLGPLTACPPPPNLLPVISSAVLSMKPKNLLKRKTLAHAIASVSSTLFLKGCVAASQALTDGAHSHLKVQPLLDS